VTATPEHLKRINAALALREIPDLPAALDQLKQAIGIAPYEPSAHLLLGLTYQDLVQNDEAEKSFRKALELDPESPDVRQALGLFLVKLNKEDEAVQFLKPLFEKDQKNVPVCLALANLLEVLNQREEAIKILQRTNEVLPSETSIVKMLAEI
jgi:Tfp pilus assembly protein PilF